jgi:hypothetical protein
MRTSPTEIAEIAWADDADTTGRDHQATRGRPVSSLGDSERTVDDARLARADRGGGAA